jgi:hypothetical protein
MRTQWWKTEGVLGRTFSTQKELIETIGGIVDRYDIGASLDQDDLMFVTDVLKHHYQWSEKSTTGVADITVEMNRTPYGTSKGFWITRNDGSRVDISWRVPISPPSHEENVAIAARYAILDQRDEANAAIPIGTPCPICGEPLLKGGRHVDHQPPMTFSTLLDAFVRLDQGTDYMHIPLVESSATGMAFADKGFADAWRRFHRMMATLRVIHKEENLRRVS